jgi:hypothetical protein
LAYDGSRLSTSSGTGDKEGSRGQSAGDQAV